MTPERIKHFKRLHIQKHHNCDSHLTVEDFNSLLADLEEVQQQLESKDKAIKLLKFNRDSWEEAEKKSQGELAEAQQTIETLRIAKDYEVELHAQSCIEYQQTIALLESELEEMTIDRNIWRSNSTDWEGQEELEDEEGETQP